MILSLARAGEKGKELARHFALQLDSAKAGKGTVHGRFAYAREGAQNPMREPLGELGLLKAGMSSADKLWQAVYWFTRNHRGHNAYLMRPYALPHTGPEARSSYYYLFNLYYVGEALRELKRLDPEERILKTYERGSKHLIERVDGRWVPGTLKSQAEVLAAGLLATQRADGSWEDSSVYGGPNYGTAMGLLALTNLYAVVRPPKQ